VTPVEGNKQRLRQAYRDAQRQVLPGTILGEQVRPVQHTAAALARLDDGTVYDNWHCFIHEVRDGVIVQTREYLDTHHAWVVLGRWAGWGQAPVPPLTRARRSNLPYVDETFQGRNPFLQLERWAPLDVIGGSK
jgi:hypothetical protein